jgi:hypothetical protein
MLAFDFFVNCLVSSQCLILTDSAYPFPSIANDTYKAEITSNVNTGIQNLMPIPPPACTSDAVKLVPRLRYIRFVA